MVGEREGSQPAIYQVKLQGVLDKRWAEWFGGMAFRVSNGITTLTGAVDHATLHGILCRIRDLNLRLISVSQLEPEDEAEEQQDEGDTARHAGQCQAVGESG